uniref:Serpentine receptor class gamma n=1 Tax=Strongyloides papillosus TaxID=174720 RepID=A0A0N5BZ11_STREA
MKIAFGPLLNSTIAASVIGCTYTVVNRYFAICKPLIFKEKWTNKNSLLLCFFQFFVPLMLFYHNFSFNAKNIYVQSNDFYAFSIPSNNVRLVNNCILFVIVSISIYITIYQNLIIFKRFSDIVNNLSSKERKKKHLMIFYMVATTLCLVILFFEQIARLIFGIVKYEHGTYFTSFLLYWILPTLAIMQPISTLIMSKQIRLYFLSFYFKPFLPKKF